MARHRVCTPAGRAGARWASFALASMACVSISLSGSELHPSALPKCPEVIGRNPSPQQDRGPLFVRPPGRLKGHASGKKMLPSLCKCTSLTSLNMVFGRGEKNADHGNRREDKGVFRRDQRAWWQNPAVNTDLREGAEHAWDSMSNPKRFSVVSYNTLAQGLVGLQSYGAFHYTTSSSFLFFLVIACTLVCSAWPHDAEVVFREMSQIPRSCSCSLCCTVSCSPGVCFSLFAWIGPHSFV